MKRDILRIRVTWLPGENIYWAEIHDKIGKVAFCGEASPTLIAFMGKRAIRYAYYEKIGKVVDIIDYAPDQFGWPMLNFKEERRMKLEAPSSEWLAFMIPYCWVEYNQNNGPA